MMRIDMHGHVLPPETFGKAGKYGPRWIEEGGTRNLEIGPYRPRVYPAKSTRQRSVEDPERRIQDMDEIGTDHMVLSISPLMYLYWAEPEIGVPFARLQNDALQRFCRGHEDRLSWVATLPVQDVPASVDELERVLENGARGVNLGANELGPYELDDEALWPIFEKIEKSGRPILLHPHPLTMASGAEDRYNLTWVVGYTYQETLAFARLTLGGVFDAFPNLKVYIPHGGGAVPYQFGRLKAASESQADVRAQRPLEEYLKNFYFDVLVHDRRARQFLYEFAGADHLVVGSNFGGWDSADGFAMLEELGLKEEEQEKISFRNCVSLIALQGVLEKRGIASA
jgi:aminocarboxymuconate-semialdehyde decarboxylase